MGKSNSAPQAPDPNQIIGASSQANTAAAILQAQLNRVNQIGPDGSTTYSNNGNTWTQNTTLSPQQQAIYNAKNGVSAGLLGLGQSELGRVAGSLNNPVDYSKLPYAPNSYDFSADRNNVTNDIYGRETALLDPQWKQRETDLSQNLADRGIGIGNEAYTTAQRDFNNQRDSSYQGARTDAITQGNAEQQALYGMASNTRAQAVNEANMAHQQPLSDIAAVLGEGGSAAMPQGYAPGATQVNPTNSASIIQQGYQNSLIPWQYQQQSNNATMGGLFGLGGAALGGWAQAGFPGI